MPGLVDRGRRPRRRARWSPPHGIVLVAGYETDDRTVSREMLHDLLDGEPGHCASGWAACDRCFD